MQPARWLPRELLDVGEEGDHVVAGALLYLQDALGIQTPRCLGAHCRGSPVGHRAGAFHGLAGRQLNAQPGLVTARVGPKLDEWWAGVPINHSFRAHLDASAARAASF